MNRDGPRTTDSGLAKDSGLRTQDSGLPWHITPLSMKAASR